MLTPILTRMVFEWTFGYHMLFLLLRDTLQNPRWDISVSSWVILMLTIPVSSLPVLFFFLVVMFRHPCEQVTCVWPDDDGCRHTERALRISLHRRRSKSQSRAILPLVILSDEPVSCRYDHPVTDDVGTTPKCTIRHEVTRYSHGLRNWAYVNSPCYEL